MNKLPTLTTAYVSQLIDFSAESGGDKESGFARSQLEGSKRSVLGGSALIVLHFSVIELEDCFESLLTGGDKKTAVGVW